MKLWMIAAAGCLAMMAGCMTPDKTALQSPDDEQIAASVKLVGDVAVAFGRETTPIDGVGLIVGLGGAGSDPPPSVFRAQMLDEMRKRKVDEPETLLASPNTALVLVRGFLKPGVQAGDTFDVEIRVPSQSQTKSLRGGRLLETRLSESRLLQGDIRKGRLEALASGPVMIEAAAGHDDSVAATQGRILGGGRALKSHSLGMLLKPDFQKVRYAVAVGNAVNRRFHSYHNGVKKNMSKPQTDEMIQLDVHPRYTHNVPRYLRVIQSLPLRESAAGRLARLELLERQLLDPLTAAEAALRLEAIGHESADALLAGMHSRDLEVRFYSAEALAYLGDEKSNQAAAVLSEVARREPAFRVFALTALGAIDEIEATEQLRGLLNGDSAETRYGAFRALWSANPDDPLIRGEFLANQFSYHVLDTGGSPMIHLTSSFRPEIVLFGHQTAFRPPMILDAGNDIRVNAKPNGPVTVTRVALGMPDQQRQVANQVDAVVRAVVELGGTYPDVVQMIEQAAETGALSGDCRVVVDAVPQAGRSYKRFGEEKEESPRFVVRNPLPNLFPGLQKKPAARQRPDMTGRTQSKTPKKDLYSRFVEPVFDRFWRLTK